MNSNKILNFSRLLKCIKNKCQNEKAMLANLSSLERLHLGFSHILCIKPFFLTEELRNLYIQTK